MKKVRKRSYCFSQLFLTLLLLMFGNTLFFPHIHKLDNGKVIAHAHPYASQEDGKAPEHSHNDSEIVFLDFVTNASFIEGHSPAIQWSTVIFAEYSKPLTTSFFYPSAYALGFSVRGPPVLV